MASITTNRRNQTRRILFVGLDGQRRAIHCGKTALRVVREVARHVDAIIAAAAAGVPLDATTAAWLGSLSDEWYGKLEKAGLVPPREDRKVSVPTVSEFAEEYIRRRNDTKRWTRLNVQAAFRRLREYFRHDPPIDRITAGQAEDFARWLKTTKKYAPATAGRTIGRVKQLFNYAVRHELIPRNPFDGVKRDTGTNPARQAYIDRDTIQRIIDAAPSAEWRLLLALARYLGLRVPSEAFALRWSDIDWERGRMRVPSPKTEHHGKPFRVVPILPEVRQYLDDVFAVAPEGAEYVLQRLIERYPSAKAGAPAANLRTTFEKIIRRAGVEAWPKLFHNLRASAQTDLAQRFPLHVVCAWIGNTTAVARDHYLQVTDDHFQAALEDPDPSTHWTTRNTTRAVRARSGFEAHREPENQKTPCFQGFSEQGMPLVGLEPTRGLRPSRF